MNKLFIFLLIFLAVGSVYAQNEDDPATTAEVYVDSISTSHYKNMYRADSVLIKKPVTENTVYPKKFKENVPSRYKGEDFDYTTTKPRMSVWEKLMKKIVEILNSIFGETVFTNSSKIAGVLVRLFAIILVGFLLYFIIKYLIGKDGGFFFGKKNKKSRS